VRRWSIGAAPPYFAAFRGLDPPGRARLCARRRAPAAFAIWTKIMLKLMAPLVFLSLIATAAQAQQERRPDPGCGRDVSRLCRPVMNEGDGVILNCLQQNRAKLSAKCAKVLTDHGQ